MRLIPYVLLTLIFFSSCKDIDSNNNTNSLSKEPVSVIESTQDANDSIYSVDFRNSTFPIPEDLVSGDKQISLKNGKGISSDERDFSLGGITYVSIVDDLEDQALVNIKFRDGGGNYEVLFVYAFADKELKLLQSFEFGEESNIFFRTAYSSHGELVLETSNLLSQDAQCCPGIIEISRYRWAEEKFMLVGKRQRIADSYLTRIK